MFDKKKINFWRLAFVFAGLTIITLIVLWGSPQEPKAQMMDGSMGSMMTGMHAKGTTLYDLLQPGQEADTLTQEASQSHHAQSPEIADLNTISTSIIFLLLPFIIGGSAFLAIVWFNKGGGA